MRNSSLATGEKNRLGVRRESSSLHGPSPALFRPKLAIWYRKFLHPKARSKTVQRQPGVELRDRTTLSPVDPARESGRIVLMQTVPVRGNRWRRLALPKIIAPGLQVSPAAVRV